MIEKTYLSVLDQDEYKKYLYWKNMEEQGKLMILSCKPGDTVYVVDEGTYGYDGIGTVKCTVDFINIVNNEILYMTNHCGLKKREEIYITEQKAQEALERMKNE